MKINFFENIIIALRSVWANKVRAFLTMLGVIIGVSAVITLIAMGQGVKSSISSEIEAMGSNLLIILPGRVTLDNGGSLGGISSSAGISTLTLDDKKAIEENVEGIENIAAIMMLSGTLKYEDKEAFPFLVGGEQELEFMNLYNVADGRFINEQDNIEMKKVVVVGKTVAADLFGEGADPLGKTVVIGKDEYEIIGVMETESLSTVGIDANSMAVMPIETAAEAFDNNKLHRIMLSVSEGYEIDERSEAIKNFMIERHEGVEDISVLTQEDILSTLDMVLGLMTALLSGIAAISLVVGGIGIMNIMLVSVTERTKEIGIRKAMGATAGNILTQFLTEAAVLSLIGGGIGVGLSYLASFLLKSFTDIAPEITFSSILMAFTISVLIGIIFGVAPAVKAARKDPIEALRYE